MLFRSLEFGARDVVYEAGGPTAVFTALAHKPEAGAEQAVQLEGRVMKAPIVGTFYAAAAPDKPPFIKEGQTVKKGDVLFIIESMKLMNEVASEYDGVISKILVENGQGVEFGQPILCIE